MTNQRTLNGKIINIISVVGIAGGIILCLIGYRLGLFTRADALEGFLARAGVFAPTLFILLQIVQVVIPIIPGGLGCLAGVLIFGPLWGCVYNYVGIVTGSVINFLLARRYGKPFVRSVVPPKIYSKYIGWLDRESAFDKWFALAIFLPFAPDDYLCLVAGMTPMRLRKFLAIIVLCKPGAIIVYSLGLTFLSRWLAGLI
ncbi:MAG: TVP38/TMEM64 family protein [Peptococcaceae bacterium]|nr:TVP38/TMEM64 family protein [Peptococcaceae bacterium]